MKLTTTLNKIRACSPCKSGWKTLLDHVGTDFDPDAPINLLTVLKSNGVQDMLWCLRATEQDSKWAAVELACRFAESVLHVFEDKYPDDKRPRLAIQAAREYLDGLVDAAYAVYAADAAYAVYAADAADAAYAAYAAAYAVYAADAADAAAYAATYAADAADVDQAAIIRSVLTKED